MKMVALLGMSLLLGAVSVSAMQVEKVAYKDCHPDLDKLDFSDRPHGCSTSKQSITLRVSGENIAQIDSDSLSLSQLAFEGNDYRSNRRGEQTYKMGSFPKIDGDGAYALFDLELDTLPFGSVGEVSVRGAVDIITSDRVETSIRGGLDIDQGFTFNAGPLTVSTAESKADAIGGLLNGAGKALAQGLQESMTGSSESEYLPLHVSGELDAYVDIQVIEAGKKLESNWSTWTDTSKTLFFPKPAGKMVDVVVRYWVGLKRHTVAIQL